MGHVIYPWWDDDNNSHHLNYLVSARKVSNELTISGYVLKNNFEIFAKIFC
jgi:hypothetical protein